MKNILFLVSGEGGLLRFIHLCISKGILANYRICSVIADRNCKAVEFAKSKVIDCRIIKYNKNNHYELLAAMQEIEFDIAITTIYKILDENIVNQFYGKLINVHPSLLPAFGGGLNAVEDAFEYGVKFIGTTVHFVDKGVDNGEIIAQSVIPRDETDTLSKIYNALFRGWCLSLLNVLIRNTKTKEQYKIYCYQKTIFNPALCFDTSTFNEEFWDEVKNSIC